MPLKVAATTVSSSGRLVRIVNNIATHYSEIDRSMYRLFLIS